MGQEYVNKKYAHFSNNSRPNIRPAKMDENPLLREHETEAIVPYMELLQNKCRTCQLASDCTVPREVLDRSGLF
jgi:hypothetical protein